MSLDNNLIKIMTQSQWLPDLDALAESAPYDWRKWMLMELACHCPAPLQIMSRVPNSSGGKNRPDDQLDTTAVRTLLATILAAVLGSGSDSASAFCNAVRSGIASQVGEAVAGHTGILIVSGSTTVPADQVLAGLGFQRLADQLGDESGFQAFFRAQSQRLLEAGTASLLS